MRHRVFVFCAGAAFLAGLIGGSGCATKKYVQTEVTTLDQKVEGLETSVEESQTRLKEHAERLTTLGSLIAKHDEEFKGVDGKFDEVRKEMRGRLIYKETLRNNEATFGFDRSDLGNEAKAALDAFVQVLIQQDRGLYLEIQGHTDNIGEESWNLLLGKKRAEAVMEYLYKQHHVPLHRMQVISFGGAQPVAENSTKEGRVKNRRVEILVYE
jgi:outer membrane protein OmpA-like peptidoglycan-associated protein